MASPTQDDGFHEIQLNGKQLVFLFMAATVVSVVIFLCGVFVGRGVRAERSNAIADAGAGVPAGDLVPPPTAAPTPAPVGSDPTAAAPPPAVDDLSYFNRLEKQSPAAEKLKASSGKGSPAGAAQPPSHEARAQPAPPPKAPGEPAASTDPSARPWGVQVAALNVRAEADAIVKRLASKGYEAYVVEPADGTSVYRVRVGKFGTRREAESLKAKLEKEEQFKPWITR